MSSVNIRPFVIFDTALRAGSVISKTDYVTTGTGYIVVKGYSESYETTKSQGFSYPTWSSADEVEAYLISLGRQNVSVTTRYNSDGSIAGFTGHYTTTVHNYYPGSISIGSYDFTKYKTLTFRVTSYSGSGKIAFGSFSQNITSAGEYAVNIESYQGNYDITFSCDSSSGFSVNDVVLA